MTYLDRSRSELRRIDEQGLRRAISRHDTTAVIDFASNDYLGLARSPLLLEAMQAAKVVGSGGSRLLSGAHPEHAELEGELARFVGRERALLFSSGYLAAIGAVNGLSRVVGASYSDEHNHASIIDALRLTRLVRHVYPHGKLPRREARTSPALVVTESVFGMSGDVANIERALEELGEDDVLLIDEAHALGAYGSRGAGVARAFGDKRIVVLGTLSKGFGCAGGFVAGPNDVIELLISTARTFIFDTSLAPGIARAALCALRLIEAGEALRAALTSRVAHARAGLQAIGALAERTGGPIVPIMIGDQRRAMEVGRFLEARGIYAPAIRPPTVPAGTSRLRVTMRADHTDQEIDVLTGALGDALG